MRDSVPTAEVLVQHTGWLRVLALRLVRDAGRADDVVQQAMLKALERPPRDREALPAWLARVTRNEARQVQRSESARVRRERRVASARREPAADPADVVARAEIHHGLVDALLGVDEPFRTALLLRYFDGLEPKEIAEHLGCPAATVRTRIKRGLERVRRRMDEQSGGRRRRWALGLVSILDPKDALVPAASGASTVAVGALVVSTKSKILWLVVLLILALGVGAVVLRQKPSADGPEEDPPLAQAPVDPVDPAPRLEGRDRESPPLPAPVEAPVAMPTAADAPSARLVFRDEAGRALAGDEVERRYREAGFPLEVTLVAEAILVPTDIANAAVRRLEGSTEGRRVLPLDVGEDGLRLALDEGRWRLLVARPGAAPLITDVFAVRPDGAPPPVEIPLPARVPTVRVRLVAAESEAPLAGASVVPFFEFGDDLAFFRAPALVADGNGVVEIPKMESRLAMPRSREPSWWVEAPGRLARVYLPRNGEETQQTVSVPATATIAGTAWRQDGRPAAGLPVVWTRKGWAVRSTVRDDGSFLLEGVPAQRGQVELFLLEDLRSLRVVRASVSVTPGERTEVVIGEPASATPRATLHGRITAGGAPVTDAIVVVQSASTPGDDGDMAKVDAVGAWRLVVPAGSVNVSVWFGGVDDFYIRSNGVLELLEGEEHRVDFDMPGGALSVTILDAESGEPIPGAGAYATAEDRTFGADRFEGYTYRAGAAGMADAEGRLLLRGLHPAQAHYLRARAEGYERVEQSGVVPAPEGGDPVEVTIRLRRK